MEIKTIKISENRYNGHYSSGSIFENSITIIMNNSLFSEEVSELTKDSILSAKFRRSFMDNKLDMITIELPSPKIEEVDILLTLIREVIKPEYEYNKDRKFNIREYVSKMTISINDDKTYEIDQSSELGKQIIELSGLNEMKIKSNKEIIESIKL